MLSNSCHYRERGNPVTGPRPSGISHPFSPGLSPAGVRGAAVKWLACMAAIAFLAGLAAGPVRAQNTDPAVAVTQESGETYRAGLKDFNTRQYERALQQFVKAYQLDERNINALFAQALSLSRMGRNDESESVLGQVLVKDGSHEKALLLLPVVLSNEGKADQALAAYDRAIGRVSDDVPLLLGKGTLLLKQGRTKEAVAALSQAAANAPEDMAVLERLAYAYNESGDLENAYRTARTILARDPSSARALAIAGDYFRMKEQYREALDAYSKAAKNIETKAYAEHFIEVINQRLEELEIEKEFEKRMNAAPK